MILRVEGENLLLGKQGPAMEIGLVDGVWEEKATRCYLVFDGTGRG